MATLLQATRIIRATESYSDRHGFGGAKDHEEWLNLKSQSFEQKRIQSSDELNRQLSGLTPDCQAYVAPFLKDVDIRDVYFSNTGGDGDAQVEFLLSNQCSLTDKVTSDMFELRDLSRRITGYAR